ncbi:MAG: DUF2203 family protein [Nitrospirae bacterium]|nr:MAG: DUF2203 family protein [Nitrospirota bacterium]
MPEEDDDDRAHESTKIFTLAEANRLIPQLEKLCGALQEGKQILIQTRDEIKKASANAHLGGGSVLGPQYICGLLQINESLQAIHELGVIIKDVDMGLCDFPYLLDDRLVYLCWKLGEDRLQWWHEIDRGYTGRQPLPDDAQ